MRFLAPKKSKQKKETLKKEEIPKIVLDFSEEAEVESDKAKRREKKDKPSKIKAVKRNIDRIKTKEGVIGHILRNAKSASIDLKDPTKIIDYAVLSSSALETSKELSKTFELGDIKHVIVEGNRVKLLSFTIAEDSVSVFMEKAIDPTRIYKDLIS